MINTHLPAAEIIQKELTMCARACYNTVSMGKRRSSAKRDFSPRRMNAFDVSKCRAACGGRVEKEIITLYEDRRSGCAYRQLRHNPPLFPETAKNDGEGIMKSMIPCTTAQTVSAAALPAYSILPRI